MALTKISTGGVKDSAIGSEKIADGNVRQSDLDGECVNESKIQISNAGTNGQFLQKQSGDTGGLTWATVTVPDSDKIEEGNTSIETVDTGSDGHVKISTEGTERVRVTNDGKVGITTTTPTELVDLGGGNKLNLKVGLRGYIGQGHSTGATIVGHCVKADTTNTVSGQMMVTETNSGGGAPSAIRQESGVIQFHTAGSGTANAVFNSERFRVGSAGQLGVGGATYGSDGQVLTSGGASAAPSWTTISAAPEITATASGAIAAGKPVAVNSNGTVSPIVATFAAQNPPTLVHQEENASTFHDLGLDCCYDEGNDRWYVASKMDHPSYNGRWAYRVYKDEEDDGNFYQTGVVSHHIYAANSMGWGQMVLAAKGKPIFFFRNGGQLQARLGTYNSSDDSISWSTVNETGGGANLQACTETFSVARIEDNKFAILFQNSSGNKCACIIATLSGTNLTKQTETELSSTNENQIPKIMWDSTNSRLVAHYAGHFRTGTLSGNAQTWGTESSVFAYAGTSTSFSDIAYDASADRYIICFYNSSNQGCYVLGTRSGNNMSASAVYVFQSTSAVSHINVAYNPEVERIGIAYNHSSGGQKGKFRQGKIDASANPPITFGSDYEYGSAKQKFPRTFYSAKFKQFFNMWQREDDNGRIQAARYNVGSLSSTSNSYVGFVDSAVSDGNTATIKVSGNTTTGQSGLTIGTKYYIKRNGNLSTTAETPEVIAGVALSATSLLIK